MIKNIIFEKKAEWIKGINMKILHILNSNAYSGAENVVITMINNMGNGFESILRYLLGKNNYILAKKIDKVVINKQMGEIYYE